MTSSTAMARRPSNGAMRPEREPDNHFLPRLIRIVLEGRSVPRIRLMEVEESATNSSLAMESMRPCTCDNCRPQMRRLATDTSATFVWAVAAGWRNEGRVRFRIATLASRRQESRSASKLAIEPSVRVLSIRSESLETDPSIAFCRTHRPKQHDFLSSTSCHGLPGQPGFEAARMDGFRLLCCRGRGRIDRFESNLVQCRGVAPCCRSRRRLACPGIWCATGSDEFREAGRPGRRSSTRPGFGRFDPVPLQDRSRRRPRLASDAIGEPEDRPQALGPTPLDARSPRRLPVDQEDVDRHAR